MRAVRVDVTAASWRKSSYSNQDGGECLEVADGVVTAMSWRKSTYSNQDGGECLEVADGFSRVVPVRDSKVPSGPVLVFEQSSWSAFIASVRD
ncbi:DUF397 domain-containing protein [Streptomyces sp. HNM0574]|uniref:DUF397 domain-containing protein n=1 Tax=Streptomyces sp. HNM0574 TaxID=2714954 RepID=UPI00146BCBFC|nr:DUF397 domain-containing protein [Streptomyces sp. HNM0574]